MSAKAGDGFRGIFLPHLGTRAHHTPSLPREPRARVALDGFTAAQVVDGDVDGLR
jgi:hypothetical protein